MDDMRRNSVIVPPKKKSDKTKKTHKLSRLLAADRRAESAPRHVEVVDKVEGSHVYCVKVYGSLDTPGSELLTVSRLGVKDSCELEMRFDERFAISIRFRKQSDEERVAYAKEQIVKAGGFEALIELFRGVFPELKI